MDERSGTIAGDDVRSVCGDTPGALTADVGRGAEGGADRRAVDVAVPCGAEAAALALGRAQGRSTWIPRTSGFDR